MGRFAARFSETVPVCVLVITSEWPRYGDHCRTPGTWCLGEFRGFNAGVTSSTLFRREPVYWFIECLKLFNVFLQKFQSPVLTRQRVRFAYAVAVITDVLQLFLGPFGWAFADQLLDVMAMILTCRLIGFHPLLLPSFVLELLPVADLLPTWTGCVAIIVALRRRQQARIPSEPPEGPVIDI